MTFGRQLFVVAAAVPLLLVGACSEDPEPKFAPPSATPTPSVTESAEPEPAAWEEKSDAGAVAFAKHWIATFNVAQESGRTTELTQLSHDGCQTCRGFVGHLNDIYTGNGRLESDGWIVRQAVSEKDDVDVRSVVTLRIKQTPQRVIHADGRVEKFAGGMATFSAHLSWTDGAWAMSELDLLT